MKPYILPLVPPPELSSLRWAVLWPDDTWKFADSAAAAVLAGRLVDLATGNCFYWCADRDAEEELRQQIAPPVPPLPPLSPHAGRVGG